MKKQQLFILMVLAVCLVSAPVSANAKKYKKQWVESKGNYRYYDENGKKVKGLKKIGKKYYCFDSKGRQHLGWQKIGKNYYFFKRTGGKKGYMVKSKTVNHIKLKKSGKAVKSSAENRLYALAEAQRIVEAATVPADKKEVKLKKTWNYFQKNYLYRGELKFRNGANWDVSYARSVFLTKKGNCYGLGAAWAYLAGACGYAESYAVSSGGHGWCEINGRVYDPSWARVDKRYSYYNMDMNMSGRNKIPNYKKAGTYKKKV
ncbi:MAG: hypothetical protein IJJ25_10085 [Lachnospiraceae bacterium]|nr:hypothetical protein [Lachnospiraceae bacterium]